MNKKGFTLIELLAVIVILAIIAVIATPIILNIVEDARKKAAADSAYGTMNGIKTYYATKQLTEDITLPITVNFGAATGEEIAGSTIVMSGQKPTAGTVTLGEDGKFTFGNDKLKVNKYDCEIDINQVVTCE